MRILLLPLLLFVILNTSCKEKKEVEVSLECNKNHIKGSDLFFNFPLKYRLSPKETLDNVKSIVIKNKPLFSLEDIDLSKFPKLDTLQINNTLVVDAFTDSGVTFNIKYLDLSNNKVATDLGLVNYKNVEYLSLRDNFLFAIPNIQELKNLKDLDLRGNNISGLPELHLNNLKKLGLSNNPVFADSTIDIIKSKYPTLEVY